MAALCLGLAMALAGCAALDPAADSSGRDPRAAAPEALRFSDLYAGSTSRGLAFSEKLRSLAGSVVSMKGFMAPPLKPALDFFVLTAQPMSVCPFCDTDASWPADIVLVYLKDGALASPTTAPIQVTGALEVGSHTDPVTGFVSQVRIVADRVDMLE
ncbi:MAG: hypothetical protein LBS11_01590 [Oscillospiraceae bacterium]|nr:hypothetical protein [Oscillospiraceae bacterium]